MSIRIQTMNTGRKLLLKDLNSVLTCGICSGYLVDATGLVDCSHIFCRGCIIKYFENYKAACPTCNVLYKKKSHLCFRSDPQVQTLVYKLVPALYFKEMQQRMDFYRTTGVRASSSCSDDSVIEKERNSLEETENWVTAYVGDKCQFFSLDEMISLSLEYYKPRLDLTLANDEKKPKIPVASGYTEPVKQSDSKKDDAAAIAASGDENKSDANAQSANNSDSEKDTKRYLRCQAAVSMRHLQKFLRMKYGLTSDHRVDIIYAGEVLPDHYTLIDVAYTFGWKREKPMRFFYRIFTPMKITPIKIINTSSSGGKQLQIVPMDTSTDQVKTEKDESAPIVKEELPEQTKNKEVLDCEDQTHKERLLANLQLQSKHKAKATNKSPEIVEKKSVCVYEYEEVDKEEEIKSFAENRDKEWALQKKLDEMEEQYITKKRKKSKHSKSDSVHKKRKLHAEITSNEKEDLKLKVKIMAHNGHKHKHHKSSSQQIEKSIEPSSKEKLLQMRKVRHKQISSEDKIVQTISTDSMESTISEKSDKLAETIEKPETSEISTKGNQLVEPNIPTTTKVETKSPSQSPENPVKTENSQQRLSPKNKGENVVEKQTFLKNFQSYTEKYKNLEKMKHDISTPNSSVQATNQRLPDKKLPNQVQAKTNVPQNRKTEPASSTEPKKLHHYPSGFTVSKIEAGTKRKAENDKEKEDKRPSLEITLINPPPAQAAKQPAENVEKQQQPQQQQQQQRRLPPATIPFERIIKSQNNIKPGVSIIPKSPEVCDNIGALDLSNKSPESTMKSPSSTITKPVNGLNLVLNSGRNISPARSKHLVNSLATKSPHQLSNLQMLSNVATEHSTIKNKASPSITNKTVLISNQSKQPVTKPQVPSLQSLKIPSPQVSSQGKTIMGKIPKLTEINKTHFRMPSPQIRTVRPNQNQNIRNIPNPSLLVRQQTQNRLNSMNSLSLEKDGAGEKVAAVTEKKEISV